MKLYDYKESQRLQRYKNYMKVHGKCGKTRTTKNKHFNSIFVVEKNKTIKKALSNFSINSHNYIFISELCFPHISQPFSASSRQNIMALFSIYVSSQVKS